MIGVAVICAESDEQAQWLHGPARLSFLRLRQGRPSTFPSPEDAASHPYTPAEREFVDTWTSTHIVGSPSTVHQRLTDLQQRTGADELMLTTNTHDHKDRLRSYQLIAQTATTQAAT
jgi:alkanesulfonate monooxygenase SsuD/methylene tetrahydromethanopterin reductase-like flavin-dependent oxidoreductase (luciferase family)